ncbi:MAG: hypothetical protein ABSB35_32875 [Bryobacteraceae bacterium]
MFSCDNKSEYEVDALPDTKDSKTATPPGNEPKSSADKAADRTATATVWIAIFTIILALVSGFTLYEVIEGGTDTHALAVAAGKQAEAATTANRAWIVVKGTSFGYIKDKTGVDRASSIVVLTNTGPSPAFHVKIWRCAQVRSTEPQVESTMPGDFPTDCDDSEILGEIGKDVPEIMHVNDISQVVPKNSLVENWHDNGKRFYAWGHITYQIFPDDGKVHFLNFCLANSLNQLTACRNGNDGKRECCARQQAN